MKYLYPLALLLFLASCQDEEKEKPADLKKTDWAFYKLEGKVKSVSEKSYDLSSGQKGSPKHEIASAHDTDLTFNERGMLVAEKQWISGSVPFEETKYNGKENMLNKVQYINGQAGIKTEHSLDKKGNLTGIIRRNGDNSQLERIAMTYNGKYMTEKKTFSNQDNPRDRTTYLYDKKGNLKTENMYMNSEYVQARTLYEYDSKNRKIAESRYTRDKLIYKITYEYDGKNVIKQETTDTKGEITYTEKNSYDKKGNLLEHAAIDNTEKTTTREVYEYDNKGNLVSLSVTVNDMPEMQALYSYDAHNNLTSVKTVNGKGETTDDRAYAYEYDTKGNWTKKTVSVNGNAFVVVERKITYFD